MRSSAIAEKKPLPPVRSLKSLPAAGLWQAGNAQPRAISTGWTLSAKNCRAGSLAPKVSGPTCSAHAAIATYFGSDLDGN